MFLNSLFMFCLWGADGKNTPPNDYVGKGESSSSRVSSAGEGVGGVIVSRQSSGGLSHESAAFSDQLELGPYYCQHIEQLSQLGELYQQNPNDPGVCRAIAVVLKKFLNSEKMDDYRDVIDILETRAFKQLDSLVKFTNIDKRTALSEEVAPLTYFEEMGQKFRNAGNIAQSRNAFERYEELCVPLVDWVEQFVEQFIKDS